MVSQMDRVVSVIVGVPVQLILRGIIESLPLTPESWDLAAICQEDGEGSSCEGNYMLSSKLPIHVDIGDALGDI